MSVNKVLNNFAFNKRLCALIHNMNVCTGYRHYGKATDAMLARIHTKICMISVKLSVNCVIVQYNCLFFVCIGLNSQVESF